MSKNLYDNLFSVYDYDFIMHKKQLIDKDLSFIDADKIAYETCLKWCIDEKPIRTIQKNVLLYTNDTDFGCVVITQK